MIAIGLYMNAFAQKEQGLYLTALDYSQGKLLHGEKKTHVRNHELLHKDLITVRCDDSVYTYSKKDVYGYADKSGVYRLVNNKAYTILNPGEEIPLYMRTIGTGFKNSPLIEKYYYSKDAAAPLRPLTLNNVLRDFSGHRAFSGLIRLCFTNNYDLLEYDAAHREFRINRLLDISDKK